MHNENYAEEDNDDIDDDDDSDDGDDDDDDSGNGIATNHNTFDLNRKQDTDKKIITLEDPVENELDGITQINANAKIGMTFARGLRSILRQDPDIVLVGEIRDHETAEIAVQGGLHRRAGMLWLSAGSWTRSLDTLALAEDDTPTQLLRGWASLALGQAQAALDGRPMADLDDVRAVAPSVLRHRVVVNFAAEAAGRSADDVCGQLLDGGSWTEE